MFCIEHTLPSSTLDSLQIHSLAGTGLSQCDGLLTMVSDDPYKGWFMR